MKMYFRDKALIRLVFIEADLPARLIPSFRRRRSHIQAGVCVRVCVCVCACVCVCVRVCGSTNQ